jgi:DNA-binding NarL/FixJ family response regulator
MVISGTRVLLVSHPSHLCAQLRLSIESHPGLRLVGEASTYSEALALASAETLDLIVVDVGATDRTALDFISKLVPLAKHVLVVSDVTEQEILPTVREADAVDLVPREQLLQSIKRRLDLDRQGLAALTKQERVIIELVAMGLTNRKIAEHLMISQAVVSDILDSVFRKLGVQNRFELLVYSLSKGLANR